MTRALVLGVVLVSSGPPRLASRIDLARTERSRSFFIRQPLLWVD